MATLLVPPSPRAFQAHMTDEFVRRFHASTAERIAPTAQCAVLRPAPMLIEVYPAIVNSLTRLLRGGGHAAQPTQDLPHFPQGQTGQRRFDPLMGLFRGALLGFGHPMEILRTMVGVEHLTGLGKHLLHVFPYPLGPITNDTQPHGLFGN
jgi:hypothetical protein